MRALFVGSLFALVRARTHVVAPCLDGMEGEEEGGGGGGWQKEM